MKKLFVLFILMVFLVVGCTSGLCPKEAVFFYGNSPIGPILYRIPPGHFNDPNNFWTEEEFKQYSQQFNQPRPETQAPESNKPDLTL